MDELFSSVNDLADFAEKEWLPKQSNGVLVQIIAQPHGNGLLNRLPGFTPSHLGTDAATVIIKLAEAELESRKEEARRKAEEEQHRAEGEARSRDARKARRPAWLSVWVPVVLAVLGSGGTVAVAAWSNIRSFAEAAWSMVH